jgi:pimeloyl-ACP methyl ester carboxylesterase
VSARDECVSARLKVDCVSADEPLKPVPSFRPGHFIWPGGRTKLVLFGGLNSKSGDAEVAFAAMLRYFHEHGGYDPRRDALEGTYAGIDQPQPYVSADTRRPLIDMAEAAAGCLDFYRQVLPQDTRLSLVGYSMGGVVGLDGATLAVARNREAWKGRLAAVVTLAAPLRGSSVGELVNWAWLVTGEPDGLGAAGDDLQARWRDPEEQTRLARRAAFLRSLGARVLTLADPDDSVVRPEEALLPAPGETAADLQVSTRITRPGSLGHGAILDEPSVWRRVLATIGPQGVSSRVADPIEDELQALKARMRREGRLK